MAHSRSQSRAILCRSGSITGLVTSFVLTPLDTVKALLQVQYHWQPESTVAAGTRAAARIAQPTPAQPLYRGPIDCARQLIRQQGLIRGLWPAQTQLATSLEMLWLGSWFGGYVAAKRALTVDDGTAEGHLSAPRAVLAGGIGGLTMTLLCFPFDVVKNRLMTQPRDLRTGAPLRYRGVLDCARQTFGNEGIAGFYKGLTPGMLRTFAANAGTFFTFELTIKLLPEHLS